MKKKSKRRYADGGNVPAASSSPTSAFSQPSQVQPSPSNIFSSPDYSGGAPSGGAGAGASGPLVTINTNGAAPATFRKGGKVKSSFKGDGIAQKGKTKGRFV